MPLQQCVDVKFEKTHEVSASRWVVEPSVLINAWELTPVSHQLNGLVSLYKGWEYVNLAIKITGALRRFLLMVFYPFSNGRLVSREGSSKEWIEELYEFVNESVPSRATASDRVAVIGHAKKIKRWIVIYVGDYPILSHKSRRARALCR